MASGMCSTGGLSRSVTRVYSVAISRDCVFITRALFTPPIHKQKGLSQHLVGQPLRYMVCRLLDYQQRLISLYGVTLLNEDAQHLTCEVR